MRSGVIRRVWVRAAGAARDAAIKGLRVSRVGSNGSVLQAVRRVLTSTSMSAWSVLSESMCS
jgi:hypothetical protein